MTPSSTHVASCKPNGYGDQLRIEGKPSDPRLMGEGNIFYSGHASGKYGRGLVRTKDARESLSVADNDSQTGYTMEIRRARGSGIYLDHSYLIISGLWVKTFTYS